jgi:hypothetical protein
MEATHIELEVSYNIETQQLFIFDKNIEETEVCKCLPQDIPNEVKEFIEGHINPYYKKMYFMYYNDMTGDHWGITPTREMTEYELKKWGYELIDEILKDDIDIVEFTKDKPYKVIECTCDSGYDQYGNVIEQLCYRA